MTLVTRTLIRRQVPLKSSREIGRGSAEAKAAGGTALDSEPQETPGALRVIMGGGSCDGYRQILRQFTEASH